MINFSQNPCHFTGRSGFRALISILPTHYDSEDIELKRTEADDSYRCYECDWHFAGCVTSGRDRRRCKVNMATFNWDSKDSFPQVVNHRLVLADGPLLTVPMATLSPVRDLLFPRLLLFHSHSLC